MMCWRKFIRLKHKLNFFPSKAPFRFIFLRWLSSSTGFFALSNLLNFFLFFILFILYDLIQLWSSKEEFFEQIDASICFHSIRDYKANHQCFISVWAAFLHFINHVLQITLILRLFLLIFGIKKFPQLSDSSIADKDKDEMGTR